jgi:WD40 repeat protein
MNAYKLMANMLFLLILSSCSKNISLLPTETINDIGMIEFTQTKMQTTTALLSLTGTPTPSVTPSPWQTVSYPLTAGPVITRDNVEEVVLLGTIHENINPSPFSSQIAWSPDSKHFAITTYRDGVKIIDPMIMEEIGEITQNIEGIIDTPGGVDYSPDGTIIAVAIPTGIFSVPNDIAFYDSKTYKYLERKNGAGGIKEIRYSHNGKWMAIGAGYSISVYELSINHPPWVMFFGYDDLAEFYYSRFSADDKYFGAVGAYYPMQIYETSTWSLLHQSDFTNSGGFCFSPDGKNYANKSGVWSMDNFSLETVFTSNYFISTCEYGINGDIIISVGNERGIINVWDSDTGKSIISLEGQEDISNLALSPDGRFIASLGWFDDKTIKIWGIPSAKK